MTRAAANPERRASRHSRDANADGSASVSRDAALSIAAERRDAPSPERNATIFASRVRALPPSPLRLSEASPGRTGTPVPSIPQHIVSDGASAVSALSDASSDAISEPNRFAARSIHFAFTANPNSPLASRAARSKLASAASGIAALNSSGVARVPSRPFTPSSSSSGQRPASSQPHVQ